MTPPISPDAVSEFARVLLASESNREDRERLTIANPELTMADGYLIQEALIAQKVADGETVIGVKLGLTSRAKQQRMGIDEPLTAVLTDKMMIGVGEALDVSTVIHPRVEPEIVFVMERELRGPGISAAQAMAAVGRVHAGLEVIDSRYRDFDFRMPDVVADNASSARFVAGGDGVSPEGLDLVLEACVLTKNGRVVDTATGAAVMGHPGEALALAANALGARGEAIPAGAIVLTGGMTDAVPVAPGDIIGVTFTSLGGLELRVVGPAAD